MNAKESGVGLRDAWRARRRTLAEANGLVKTATELMQQAEAMRGTAEDQFALEAKRGGVTVVWIEYPNKCRMVKVRDGKTVNFTEKT